MSKAIQIRNVPEDLHRRLKARAAMEGMSLSDWLLAELRKVAAHPSRKEVLERLAARRRDSLVPSAADILREERESR